MSIFSRLLGAIFGSKPKKAAQPVHGIPTVKFDSSQVTEIVKADIRKNVELLEGVDSEYFDRIYDAAVRSVMAGRDLSLLFRELMEMNISGMTKERAEQISRSLNNKATVIINVERKKKLGIKKAIWRYSGVPCMKENRYGQSDAQNEEHRKADGKTYDIDKGMFLDGKWTWPGYEEGCRCTSRSIIKGFNG